MNLPFLRVDPLSRGRRLARVFGDHSIARATYRLGIYWETLISRHPVVLIFAGKPNFDLERYYASRQLSALNGDVGVQWLVPWGW